MSALSPAVRDRLERLKTSTVKLREKAKSVTKNAVETGETSATAGVIGYIEAKRQLEGKPPMQVFGASLEGAIGLAAHAAGLAGVVGESQAEHLRAVGNGAFAVLAYKKGRELGSVPAGALPGGGI